MAKNGEKNSNFKILKILKIFFNTNSIQNLQKLDFLKIFKDPPLWNNFLIQNLARKFRFLIQKFRNFKIFKFRFQYKISKFLIENFNFLKN